jgi:molybdopterin converting factor small subunit
MAVVHIPTLLRRHTGGVGRFELQGTTVGELLDQLEQLHPGIKALLLRSNLAVSVDDEISPLGGMESVHPDSEVHFVAAISGG